MEFSSNQLSTIFSSTEPENLVIGPWQTRDATSHQTLHVSRSFIQIVNFVFEKTVCGYGYNLSPGCCARGKLIYNMAGWSLQSPLSYVLPDVEYKDFVANHFHPFIPYFLFCSRNMTTHSHLIGLNESIFREIRLPSIFINGLCSHHI